MTIQLVSDLNTAAQLQANIDSNEGTLCDLLSKLDLTDVVKEIPQLAGLESATYLTSHWDSLDLEYKAHYDLVVKGNLPNQNPVVVFFFFDYSDDYQNSKIWVSKVITETEFKNARQQVLAKIQSEDQTLAQFLLSDM